jgi:hypothetical protein
VRSRINARRSPSARSSAIGVIPLAFNFRPVSWFMREDEATPDRCALAVIGPVWHPRELVVATECLSFRSGRSEPLIRQRS